MTLLSKTTTTKIGVPGIPKNPTLKSVEFPKFTPLFKQAWIIYRQHLKKFIGMYLLLLTPALIGGGLIAIVVEMVRFNNSAVLLPALFILLVLFIFAIVVGAYSMIFLIKGLDNNIGIWQAYVQAWKYFWRYLLLFILLFIFIGLGFVAFVIPGLILMVWLSQVFYVAAFENIGGIAALQRSKSLVAGYWWTILERYLYWLFVVLGVNVFLLLPLIILIFAQVPENITAVVQGFVSLVGVASNFIIIPVGILYTYLIYKNLRAIKDQNVKVFDGMTAAKKFGIVALILVYLAVTFILDSSTGEYDTSTNSGFNYQLNLDQ